MNDTGDSSAEGALSGSGSEEADEDGGAIGIFPSWGWVYGSVIVYTVLAITILHVFTVTFDHGLP